MPGHPAAEAVRWYCNKASEGYVTIAALVEWRVWLTAARYPMRRHEDTKLVGVRTRRSKSRTRRCRDDDRAEACERAAARSWMRLRRHEDLRELNREALE